MKPATRFEYCLGWNDLLWEYSTPITEDDARRRYASSSPNDWFTVVAFGEDVPADGIPDYTMEVVPNGDYFQVLFFDQSRSIRFIYGLRKKGDRLFHEDVTEYSYSDSHQRHDQDEASVIDFLQFQPDGIVHQRKDDKSQPTIEKASYRDVDVSSHWEPIPEFGDWESVARFDR